MSFFIACFCVFILVVQLAVILAALVDKELNAKGVIASALCATYLFWWAHS